MHDVLNNEEDICTILLYLAAGNFNTNSFAFNNNYVDLMNPNDMQSNEYGFI